MQHSPDIGRLAFLTLFQPLLQPLLTMSLFLFRLPMPLVASIAAGLSIVSTPAAQAADAGTAQKGQVPQRIVVSGAVPDDSTKLKVLEGVRRVYGDHAVVDQISIGGVQAPPNWIGNLDAVIAPQLRSVSKGTLAIEGTNVTLRGEVGDESTREGIERNLTKALTAGYTFKNGLRVFASSQALLDRTLDGRVIEFENGSALLTASGMRILDEMADAMKKMKDVKIEVIGHTDSIGAPAANVALSRGRADSVKTYLVRKGIMAEYISTSGMGADQPVASNTTDDGRKRNRRIEFRAARH